MLTGLGVDNTLKFLNLNRILPVEIEEMLQTVEITNYTLANYKDELKGFENEKAGIMQLDAKPSCKEEVKNEEA